MPELAEVEFFRRQWNAGLGARVTGVLVHDGKRPLRDLNAAALARALRGAVLESSAARGKQMLFRFSGGAWIGLHLGMTGSLRVEDSEFLPGKHDHLVLRQRDRTLVFSDPRGFGRVLFHRGAQPPAWWTRLPAPPHDASFTLERLREILRRHARAPLKAVLLRQDRFPGVGNWMADEILWRARLHPATRPAKLTPEDAQRLWREIRFVCRGALRIVAKDYSDPPASWLFPHRWKDGGRCPRDAAALRRATVGGRTTAWCPRCQPRGCRDSSRHRDPGNGSTS